MTIVTKVGSVRDDAGSWLVALSPSQLRAQVHDNLRTLGVDVLDVVNLRVGGFDSPTPGSLAPQFETLAELRSRGLIRHLGLSTVSAEQLTEARSIAPVVTVQNMFNVVRREDLSMVELTAAQGIAYVPYFPLGGFSPVQSSTLGLIAKKLDTTSLAVALAWLLQRSPNILPIPGTSSVAHLRDNVAATRLELPADVVRELDGLA